MAALPLNTAPHFVFYYRFCNSLDFYCAQHPKKLFLSFSRTFCDYQGDFFKIQGQFQDKFHFFRIPGVFKDQGHFQGLFKVCANPVLVVTAVHITASHRKSPLSMSTDYYTVKKSVDFTVKYLASGCQFFYRYFYGRLPVEHFLEIKIW